MRSALIIFAIIVIAQWLVPCNSIRSNERVLREGTPLNFRTAPVDPHDPFRGEYVVLYFTLEQQTFRQPLSENWTTGQRAFVLLKQENGFAEVDHLSHKRPAGDTPYLTCDIDVWDTTKDSTNVHLDLPFDRYYLKEGRGRRAEELIRETHNEETREFDTYVTVRVLEGEGAIEELVIGGKTLEEWGE